MRLITTSSGGHRRAAVVLPHERFLQRVIHRIVWPMKGIPVTPLSSRIHREGRLANPRWSASLLKGISPPSAEHQEDGKKKDNRHPHRG